MKLHKESHVDHVSTQIIEHVMNVFGGRDGFFIQTIELPGLFVECGLHGPACGDLPVEDSECWMAARPGRDNLSRLCKRSPRQTQTLTVIGGPHDGESCVLYTVFGGPVSPKEPTDPTLKPEEREASERFWKQHALSGQ